MKSSLDILPALFMIAVSVITVLGVSGLHYWSGYSPGPAFTPYWIVAAALVLSLLIIVQTILSKSCNKPEWPERSGIFRILLTSLSLVLILILTPFLGMIITITLFSLFLLLGILRRPLIHRCHRGCSSTGCPRLSREGRSASNPSRPPASPQP